MAFKAHFLNVGCADCTIIEIGRQIIMVDCGYRRIGKSTIKKISIHDYLKYEIGKTFIDLLIISHPHHDHYLGIEELISKIGVGEFWGSPYKRRYADPSLSYDEWNEYVNLKAKLVPDLNNRFICWSGARKKFSECELVVLGPRRNINKNETREIHDACLVIWVSSPANKFVICGDASDSQLDQIRIDWNISGCTVLRASHHGSINGANLEFIKAASPRDAVISTQSGIFKSIPDNAALEKYQKYSQDVFRTDTNGTCITPLVIQ